MDRSKRKPSQQEAQHHTQYHAMSHPMNVPTTAKVCFELSSHAGLDAGFYGPIAANLAPLNADHK
jgi:hypothetical protein